MKLELYQNMSDTKKVGKNLSLVTTLTPILIKNGTDLLHPVFTFHKFRDAEGDTIWKNFNYAKLIWSGFDSEDPEEDITRCYFVDKFVMLPGGIIEIHCSIDVRETWKAYILGQNYLVRRQEFINNKSIADERKVIPLNRTVQALKLKNGGNDAVVGDGGDGTIVLTVTGGV